MKKILNSKPFKIIATIIKTLCIILAVIVLIIIGVQRFSNNKVNLFGIGVYTIITESMYPEYEVGDMIFAKETPLEELKVGDDVVYQGEVDSFKDKIITHRIKEINGENIQTRGINNQFDDPPITYKQVYGKVVFKFTLLSLFSKLMNDTVLFYFVVFIPFSLLIFFDIIGMINDKKALQEEIDEENKKIEEEPKVEEEKVEEKQDENKEE